MKTQQPIIREDDEHRVLKFVPRTSAQPPSGRAPGAARLTALGAAPVRDEALDDKEPFKDKMARFEQAPDEPDDFRHRMMANTAAFALTAALTGMGIWLAISIADLRKTQDCVLMGRRDCARISTPQG